MMARKRWSRRNLGPGEQWGREVETEIESLSTQIESLRNSANLNNQQINGTLNTFSTMIQTLQEQQEILTEQQAQILDTINKLSTASVWWAASTNVLIAQAPAYTDVANIVNLRVPEGYSQALILGVSQVDLTAYSSSAFSAFQGGVATVIGGQAGWLMPVHGYPQYEIDLNTSIVQSEYQATTSASSSTVRFMEGLTTNQQIVVSTRLQAGAGNTNIYGTATTSCQAIYFK
jgi:hypothetical protein